ncbi:hypothetical protein LCGC14_2425310 [marine sediment metagenome]|uniref:Prohead serine protease domain-containing protein n=1 Tax=marine sediment metagenome TaxID=412755 RepID=A0A0F9BNH6_9ZZZZ
MPLPTPNADEEQDDFIARCMSDDTAKEDFPDDEQRLAICHSQWGKDKEENTMPKDREERTYPFLEVRIDDGDEGPKITGYAAVFNKLSVPLFGFREQIAPGAFSKTIRKADVKALWNHDPGQILGRTKNRTLSLEEDIKGLKVEILPPDTQLGRDATELIKRGDVDQMSFLFETVRDIWENPGTDKAIRTLQEVDLFDVSPVTFPAYPQTSVKVRSMMAEVGLSFEALTGLFTRVQRGLSLTQTDHDLINASIEVLNSYLPKPELQEDKAAPVSLTTLRRKLELLSN